MTKKTTLTISFSSKSLGFFATQKNGKDFYKSIEYNSPVQQSIDIFFLENLNFRDLKYDEVLLISFEKDFVILPSINDEIQNSQREILQKFIVDNNFSKETNSVNKLNFLDSIKNYACETLYKVDEELYQSIANQFDNFKFNHCTNLFLNHVFCSNQDELHFLVDQDSLLISIFREEKLIFCNLFFAKIEEEVLYYILKTTSLLNLENSSLLVFYYGFLDRKSNLLEKLHKIFPQLKAGEKNEKKRMHFLSYSSLL